MDRRNGSLVAPASTQQLSLTGRRSQTAAVLLFEKNFKRPNDGELTITPRFVSMIAYVYEPPLFRRIEQVPDNRL